MHEFSYSSNIVLILTFGFALASIFGYIAKRLHFSPILGYLFAGYIIGPYSPGFTADITVSEQLAEIGVILMMFGVGLQFNIEELLNVKSIAIPGAILQTSITTLAGLELVHHIGWSVQSGLILGFGIGVASTVVLVRVLSDNQLLRTQRGHIAVGWLVVEDIMTVIALLLLPIIVSSAKGEEVSLYVVAESVAIILFKFSLLVVLMFTIGQKVVYFIFDNIATVHSGELFTVTILALIFVITLGSSVIFGTSIALGAFIAGLVLGRTHEKLVIAENSLPMKDAFVVLFFTATGMLFNPEAIIQNPYLFIGILAIILVLKPLAAVLIVVAFRYPIQTAVTIALALAQIGEFTFILAEQANKFNVLPDEGYDIVIACALISIALNPLLFKLLPSEEKTTSA
jgi:CPA2 family monovalent cation:H+ antiporter-2